MTGQPVRVEPRDNPWPACIALVVCIWGGIALLVVLKNLENAQ